MFLGTQNWTFALFCGDSSKLNLETLAPQVILHEPSQHSVRGAREPLSYPNGGSQNHLYHVDSLREESKKGLEHLY